MTLASIYTRARQSPDTTAVVCNGVRCSYADFARRIDAARQFLAKRDLPAGTLAVTCFSNPFDDWVVGFALRSLGHTTVAASNAKEASGLGLRNIGSLVTATAESRPELSALASAARWRYVRVPLDVQWRAADVVVREADEATTHCGGHILQTSGTTGEYKMVVRDPATEAVAIPLLAEINGVDEASVVYVANFGLWTAGGYRWPLMTWSVGGTVVIQQAPDLHLPLSRHSMTHMFSTPEMLSVLMRTSAGALTRNDAMRLLVTGGAMPAGLLADAKRFLTRQVYSMLASTEASTLAMTPLEHPEDLLWHRILPSREVQVVDEAGVVCAPGQEGLIRVRIIDGLKGYLEDEAATREFFRDGFFYPGDLGVLGADGRLSLHGRASDVVNVLGHKVATAPLERALQDRLGVDGVCIVSIRGGSGDDEIHVAIQSGRKITPAEWDAAATIELAMMRRVPVHVDFIDALPKNAMGKVVRQQVKEQVLEAVRIRDAAVRDGHEPGIRLEGPTPI
ncbi:MAG: fatty acid--CoA ligase family protein [Betaproteobacteria bacterium]